MLAASPVVRQSIDDIAKKKTAEFFGQNSIHNLESSTAKIYGSIYIA